MKVIIPVAGEGSKLLPHTHTQPKALVPVAGKPIIAHIIDFMLEGGVTKFVFVIGYMGHLIKEYILERYKDHSISIQFVVQDPREGSAHAIRCAKANFEHDSSILIALGDTILNLDLKAFLSTPYSSVGVQKISTPSQFGIVEMNREGYAKKFIEKPKIPKSNLALVGLYKINNIPLFVQVLDNVIENNILTNNEYHLTDALQLMVEANEKFIAFEVNGWYDCGKKDSLLKSNSLLLKRMNGEKIHHKFPNTILIPPVKIGTNCKISDSIIGPNVVIADNSLIQRCIIRNSIIGTFSKLDSLTLDDSLIGNNSSFQGVSQILNAGDNTELKLG
jgi:glucose-1-phosphate thymidylyltransferase